MTELEVFQLSAKACGRNTDVAGGIVRVNIFGETPTMTWMTWNPFVDDSQRWECVKKLLDMGWKVSLNPTGFHAVIELSSGASLGFKCHAEELHARALSELENRK